MTPSTLANVLRAIRAEGVQDSITESDALAISNAMAGRFSERSVVGDALTTCGLAIDDELNNTPAPTLDDIAALADFRRRVLAERNHEGATA